MNGWLFQSLGIVKDVCVIGYRCYVSLMFRERSDVLKLIHLCSISQLSVVGVYVCILLHNAS